MKGDKMKKLYVLGMILMMLPLAFAAQASTTATVRVMANSGPGVMTASLGPVVISPQKQLLPKPVPIVPEPSSSLSIQNLTFENGGQPDLNNINIETTNIDFNKVKKGVGLNINHQVNDLTYFNADYYAGIQYNFVDNRVGLQTPPIYGFLINTNYPVYAAAYPLAVKINGNEVMSVRSDGAYSEGGKVCTAENGLCNYTLPSGDLKVNGKIIADQTSFGYSELTGRSLTLYAMHYQHPGTITLNVSPGVDGIGQLWTDKNLRIYSNGEIFLDAGNTYTEGYFYAKQGINTGGFTDDVGLNLQAVQNQTSNLMAAYDENYTLKSWIAPDGRIYSNGDEVCTPSNHLCGAGFTGAVTLSPTRDCTMVYEDGRLIKTDCVMSRE